jgi:hypothetical protein
MLILQYHGRSLISRVILAFRPPFTPKHSHSSTTPARIESGYLVGDTSEYESWHKGGVCHREFIGQAHTKGTRVDVYELRTPLTMEDEATYFLFLKSQEGKGYDWRGVFCYGTRRDKQNPLKWFCCELILAALRHVGRILFGHLQPHQVHPATVSTSPELRYRGYIILGESGGYRLHSDQGESLLTAMLVKFGCTAVAT